VKIEIESCEQTELLNNIVRDSNDNFNINFSYFFKFQSGRARFYTHNSPLSSACTFHIFLNSSQTELGFTHTTHHLALSEFLDRDYFVCLSYFFQLNFGAELGFTHTTHHLAQPLILGF